jgi:hypothetical protein
VCLGPTAGLRTSVYSYPVGRQTESDMPLQLELERENGLIHRIFSERQVMVLEEGSNQFRVCWVVH